MRGDLYGLIQRILKSNRKVYLDLMQDRKATQFRKGIKIIQSVLQHSDV